MARQGRCARKKRPEPTQLRRGKRFEKKEKAGWTNLGDGKARFEKHVTTAKGRRGRVDIFIDELGGLVAVVEIKATNWDRIMPHRVRSNILRHARQVWKYVETFIEDGTVVCPGIVYPKAPRKKGLKEQIEEGLNEQGIQVVWRDD